MESEEKNTEQKMESEGCIVEGAEGRVEHENEGQDEGQESSSQQILADTQLP